MNLLYYLYGLCLLIMTSARGARVVVSLYALDLGASPLTVGMLAASFSLMPVLLAWPVGRWADRAGARWPMLAGALGATLSMLLPFAFHTLPVLFIAALLSSPSTWRSRTPWATSVRRRSARVIFPTSR